jgi:acyl-CoA synthetase (AMP-forming)/AMP-acid ligase II
MADLGTTIVERLRRHAAEQPTRRALAFLRDAAGTDTLTYRELDERARRIAAELVAATSQLRDEQPRALLLLPQSLAFVEALFGAFYAGACAVPAHAPSSGRGRETVSRLRMIAADARPHVVLTTRGLLADREAVPELAHLPWIAVDELTGTPPQLACRATGEHLAILQYSSGSTSDPRGVMVTHANLMHNEAIIEQAFEHTPQTVVFGWLPFQHDMGLIGNVLQPIYAGAECVLMTPIAFLKQPLRWMREISNHRATTSGAPNFAYELCARRASELRDERVDLSSWNLAYVGAEPVRASTMERFARAFEPYGFRREALYPCYGLAEATLMVTGGRRADPVRVADVEARARVSCGVPRLGQRVAIVDPATLRPVSDGAGEIWVSGESVARGYFGKPDATRTCFGARLDGHEGEWLRTGDIGRLVDGELYVTGRLKDIAVVRGVKYAAEDVEHTVDSVNERGLRSSSCAVFSLERGEREQLVVVQEIERGANAAWDTLAQRIAAAVIEVHGVRADVIALVKAGAIPRTTSGKIRRAACRELFASSALDEVHRHASHRA